MKVSQRHRRPIFMLFYGTDDARVLQRARWRLDERILWPFQWELACLGSVKPGTHYRVPKSNRMYSEGVRIKTAIEGWER